ncbi:hypothetical protein [Rhodohalobacter sp. SW132]|uniref:hypothetical protein n=1 Tax=Rhodohalobacter sp. SW132 TaxID=2293433 RepID=UPI0013140328|nr:hypothetical protein [Rhodohalobacter sp. SW132]
MTLPFIFSSGIIVVILFLIGVIYTFKEFKEMEKHPEDYRRNYDRASIDKNPDKSEK